MLICYSEALELRGIANKVSAKTGNVYYTLNVESSDGTPHALYCPDAKAFADGLKKGDAVQVEFEVNRYKGNEKLVVTRVEKVK